MIRKPEPLTPASTGGSQRVESEVQGSRLIPLFLSGLQCSCSRTVLSSMITAPVEILFESEGLLDAPRPCMLALQGT